MFSGKLVRRSAGSLDEDCRKLKQALSVCDAVVIGAGAGLSTAAGFVYSGERFFKYFSDFEEAYGFHDMYSGGFYPYETLEEHWAYWSRYIYVNRYLNPPKPVYEDLLALIREKDYFVLTTNVDHCFQKAGFDKNRLFYTQGDYGLLQCSKPCRQETCDNKVLTEEMLRAQGFVFDPAGKPVLPAGATAKMRIADDLIPCCPHCGRPMTMNLRSDEHFAEDAGWHAAAKRYTRYLHSHAKSRILYLELGVGYNTPGIIKYPFWQETAGNPHAVYACVNQGEAYCPAEISRRAICIDAEIGEVLALLNTETPA